MNQQASAEVGNVALRVVLLATLLFAVNAWAIRHLGLGLGEFTVVNTFFGFVYLSIGYLAKGQEESINEAVRRAFARALTIPVLLTICVLALVLTSFLSSVTILAAGQPGSISTRLTAEGHPPDESRKKELQGPDGMVQYWTFISPFGSSFYLLADGYLREPVQILPWVGATIRVGDLTRLPSILLRVPYQHHGSLKDAVLHISPKSLQDHTVKLAAQQAAVLLGPETFVPESNQQNWRSELRTLSGVPASLQETFFRNWAEPLHAQSIPALSPGQQVRVTFTTAAGKSVAQKSFTVGPSTFQDVLLINMED